MEHCLAAEKFANRRSHNCVAITPPGVGRGTGTFELQRLMAVVWGEDFAESNRSTVAELAGPVPKLVAAVTHGVGIHIGSDQIAGEELRKLMGLGLFIADVEHLGDFGRIHHQFGCRCCGGGDPAEACAIDLTSDIVNVVVGRKIVSEAVGEVQAERVRSCFTRGSSHYLFLSARIRAAMFAG